MSKNTYRLPLRMTMLALVASLVALFPAARSSVPSSVEAQATPPATVVLLHQVIAGLYQGSGANASTAVFLIHETSDFINATPCVQLVQRGFTALCAKSQFTQSAEVDWNQIALDVSYGVSYLRSVPGVQHVVLVGWSGGGAIMAYYQNVAENGVATCQAPARLDPCDNSLAGLPRADGVVMLDAIPGLAFSNMSAWDASVNRPDGLTSHQNPSLYLFNPANGYNSNQNQSSSYSRNFIDRYTQAQAERESNLVIAALQARQDITSGHGDFTDDMPFPVGHDAARIWQQDTSLLAHTKGQYPLITPTSPNGAVQAIDSVRVPAASVIPSSPEANNSWAGSGKNFTVNTFLSTSAIQAPNYRLTADSIEGVDWNSSNTATVSNVRGISVPILMMSMTAHYWVVPTEMYYQAATKSHDKTLAYVYGAIHTFTPCTVCPTPLGPFGDTVAETFNYVASWLQAKF
ncbi:MAG TPA: hypothetical protein VK066_09365 [Chloroflexota bacterium]|nr:hypothetical protein [Chloroflexota bacterium]